jgi:hypothetical protein
MQQVEQRSTELLLNSLVFIKLCNSNVLDYQNSVLLVAVKLIPSPVLAMESL